MEESKQNIHEALRDLHDALETAQDLDASDRGEIAAAIDEIRGVLDDSDAENQSDTLGGRLRAAVEHFEGRHPELTALIGRVADSLSEMGI